MNTDQIMRSVAVIPVMLIDDLETAVPLSRALVAGGLNVLEITLRTPVALAAIEAIIGEVEGAVVGAGTVLNPKQLEQITKLGCKFAVSPGATPALLDAANQSPCPLLPGTATASEVMQLLDRGYTRMKFFPAEAAGGIPMLKSLASPLQDAKFCPTGGIGLANAPNYLALDNVLCVGGSWMAPKTAIETKQWDKITSLARQTAHLK